MIFTLSLTTCSAIVGRSFRKTYVTPLRGLLLPSSVWMMVSAEKSVESVMGAAEHQPDAYLIKPITEGVLLTRLNRAWHKKQVFRYIDQAYQEKDYLRAARMCDEQILINKVHETDLLRMKATGNVREFSQYVREKILASGHAAEAAARPQIEAGEFSSLTGTAAVIGTAAHSKGAKVEIYVDQVGSTIAGAGLKVTFVWRRVS